MINGRTQSSEKLRSRPDQMQSYCMQLNLEEVKENYSHYYTGVLT